MPVNSIPITLDRERHLRFDFNALCLLEDELGVAISDFPKIMSGKVRFNSLRAILWAGLSHEDDGLTLKDVGNMIDPTKPRALGEVASAIRKAFEAAFAVEGAETQKKGAGTK